LNFEFTDIPEQYIHRIGRTGRADKVVLVMFISPRRNSVGSRSFNGKKKFRFTQFQKVLKLQFDYWSLKDFKSKTTLKQ
jgi:superfamily II DNA/RNA helicase